MISQSCVTWSSVWNASINKQMPKLIGDSPAQDLPLINIFNKSSANVSDFLAVREGFG